MNIEYSIIYSNRKTISIIVERDSRVIVRAPHNTSKGFIEKEVAKRKRLLSAKIKSKHKYPSPKPVKEFVSGESLLYLGKEYTLYVVDELDGISFDSKFFIGKNNQKKAVELFKGWYSRIAKETLVPKAEEIAKQLGVSYSRISIRDLKYRWGSCTPKDNIHFNWRLIKAPMHVIEYIIVHELTHLLEPNHTPEFWNRVAVLQPGFRKAKEWLKENGVKLEMEF